MRKVIKTGGKHQKRNARLYNIEITAARSCDNETVGQKFTVVYYQSFQGKCQTLVQGQRIRAFLAHKLGSTGFIEFREVLPEYRSGE